MGREGLYDPRKKKWEKREEVSGNESRLQE